MAGERIDRRRVLTGVGAATAGLVMVANAHIMSAGVVGITRAQEYGYTLITVG